MSTVLAWSFIGYASLVLLWLMYVQVMAAIRVWNDLHWMIKCHLILVAIIFIPLDVAVNAIIGTLLFAELPRWWTLSERLNYHATRNHGWRTAIASWICSNVLNPFDDDGHHCGKRP